MYVCIHVYMYKVYVYMYRYKSTFSPEENVMTFFFHTTLFSSRRGKKRMRADRENRFLNPINELKLINQPNRTKTR